MGVFDAVDELHRDPVDTVDTESTAYDGMHACLRIDRPGSASVFEEKLDRTGSPLPVD